MKRKIAVLLCAAMVLGSLTACGSNQAETEMDVSKNASAEMELSEGVGDYEGELSDASGSLDGVSYVMIYNPYIYNESDENGTPSPAVLNTGDFSSQIVMGMNRAGDLGSDIEVPVNISQAEINKDVDTSGANREGVRAGAMDPEYSLYDTHEFFHSAPEMISTVKDTFECLYVGEYCYIWSLDGSISEADAAVMGQEFDTNIYLKDVEAFGTARFTDNGGKVNLLFYPLKEGIGGFFTLADIFSSAEVNETLAEAYKFNTDHAIVHINSRYVTENPGYAKSTMTHEFQHLICASDCFNYSETPVMKTWLNEAMSAYAEEMVYPGIKEEGYYNQFFYLSDNFRKGQSLYNFDTTFDEYIGAYGVVYLFSQYLSEIAGDDVFSNVHSYWRNSYSATVTEAEALANSVPADVYADIDSKYTYSDAIAQGFATEDEEWISKLTLDFYIETLSVELANLHEYEDQVHALMLYGEINPLDIEGGGRIVVATQNGSYEIPADADPNLVYIGLDENFEPISMFSAQ